MYSMAFPTECTCPEAPVKYSIVIPTFNERESLPILVALLWEALEACDFEILVVDDNSPDDTRAVCRELMRVFSEIPFTLIMRPGKMGLGSAYKAGLAVTRGEFIVLMDADLSHHVRIQASLDQPQHIPEMILKQQHTGCDVVSGTRYSLGGGVAGWGFKRILISRVANFGAQLLLRPRGSDLTGSFRLYRADVLKSILPEMCTKGYTFQMEILVRATRLGLTIEQVPIVFVDRLYGESKLGGQEFLNYAMGLLQLFWWV